MMDKVKDFLSKVDPGYFYLLLQLVNFVFKLVDTYVLDLFFGISLIHGSRKERKNANKSDLAAHVVNVHYMASMGIGMNYDLSCFFLTHDKYEDLDFIANNANVTFFAVDKTKAVFVVTDPSVDVYCTKSFPFTAFGQQLVAKKLVIIDHATLHRLAERLGDPAVPVSIVNMTARCGSTLLTQMISKVPKTRAMGEPYPMVHIHKLYQTGDMLRSEYERMMRSVMRVQCKVEPSAGVERIFIKMVCYNAAQFGMLHKLFPEFALFFNTRQLTQSFLSLKKVIAFTFKDTIAKKWGFQRRHTSPFFAVPYDSPEYERAFSKYEDKLTLDISAIEHLAVMSALVAACYEKDPKVYKDIIFYEDLRKDPKATMEKIFEHAKIPMEHVPAALSALKDNSQNDLLGPRGANGIELTREEKDAINRKFKEFKVPLTCDMSLEAFNEYFTSKR